MSKINIKPRTIFCGDNLDVLRGINSDSVDLIYLDPPFNKNKEFFAPIGTDAEGASFKDVFRKGDVKDEWLDLIQAQHPKIHNFIEGIKLIGHQSNAAYLCYMAVRLIEMHRVLKDTGSLYLHCDQKMSHYLKILLDCIFGENNFKNEIIWCYKGGGNAKLNYKRKHDAILFYAKREHCFNWKDISIPYKKIPLTGAWRNNTRAEALEKAKKKMDEGMVPYDWWDDIPAFATATRNKERVGYPTQKPTKLLERIISASSNKGDVVLDPFCGCATTCVAAEKLERDWIGIDVSNLASKFVKIRMAKEIPEDLLRGKSIFRKDIPVRTDIKKAGKNKKEIKDVLYGNSGGICVGCEAHMQKRHLDIDHVVPRAKGGGDNIENLQLLCGACNSAKGDKSMAEFMTSQRERGFL